MYSTKKNYRGLYELTIREANSYFIKEVITFTTKEEMLAHIRNQQN